MNKLIGTTLILAVAAVSLTGCMKKEIPTEADIVAEAKEWCESEGNYFYAFTLPETPQTQYVCTSSKEDLETIKADVLKAWTESR